MRRPDNARAPMTRRLFLGGTVAACAGTVLTAGAPNGAEKESDAPDDTYRISRRRIRQSVMGWCYNPMPTEQLIDACHRMGMPAIEGINAKFYPRVRELGMKIGIVGSHGFQKGPANRENLAFCIQRLREGIDLAAKYGSSNVITFTGMRPKGPKAPTDQKPTSTSSIRCSRPESRKPTKP